MRLVTTHTSNLHECSDLCRFLRRELASMCSESPWSVHNGPAVPEQVDPLDDWRVEVWWSHPELGEPTSEQLRRVGTMVSCFLQGHQAAISGLHNHITREAMAIVSKGGAA